MTMEKLAQQPSMAMELEKRLLNAFLRVAFAAVAVGRPWSASMILDHKCTGHMSIKKKGARTLHEALHEQP